MAFLYFKNTTTAGEWNDVTNWFTDSACTTQAANVPWVAGDSTYLGYDLTRSPDSITAEDHIYINADIGDGLIIGGICDISSIGVSGTLEINNGIYNGTFSGFGIFNSGGTVHGGTFQGDSFNNGGAINNGTFEGNSFSNSASGYIYNGTFEGDGFTNSGYIYNGTFSGDNFYNYLNIYGGQFSGNGGAYTSANVYGGLFDSVTTGLTSPVSNYGGVAFDFTLLSDALFIGGSSWNSSAWYEDYNCTIPWTGTVPWTDSSTEAKHLLRGNIAEVYSLSSYISIDTTIGSGFSISGTCDITYSYDGSSFSSALQIDYGSYIYAGNFDSYGMGLSNGTIYGGTFSGDNFNSYYGYIYGGTFEGDYFYNSYTLINGGMFEGDYFSNNYGGIFGGIFSGDYFNNSYSGDVFGGIFTGNSFTNNDYQNGEVYGGIFTGDNFYNGYSTYIYGGMFSGSNITNNGYLMSWSSLFFLQTGTLDAYAYYDYLTGLPLYYRVSGFNNGPPYGITILTIPGQDVLGGGLL